VAPTSRLTSADTVVSWGGREPEICEESVVEGATTLIGQAW
jgi:hypothetical protein